MTNNEGIIFINCPNCGESLEINSQQTEEICPICKSTLDIQTLAVAEPQPTRKDKIKELLGRNLNSYHAKAKQLLTDIEKKNKEQNHKISVLTNKLDNDYLTKTEEGSVISLDYSKEGMVYLDELQGNTMVNYCTDGSKELTLNGDIDVEGTFVTTTEGVDNGLIDVMCEGHTAVNISKIKNLTPITAKYGDIVGNEGKLLVGSIANKKGYVEVEKIVGNTLVNIVTTYDIGNFFLLNATKQDDNYFKLQYGSTVNSSYVIPRFGTHLYKPNTTYTVIVEIKENTTGQLLGMSPINSVLNDVVDRNFENPLGISTMLITTKSDFNSVTNKRHDFYFGIWKEGVGDLTNHITFRYWILEGDYTNKPIPNDLFHGLQSSFEENLVTQEMITEGLEDAENLGKYKVPVKVVGKNKFDGKYLNCAYGTNSTFEGMLISSSYRSYYIKCKPNTSYYIKCNGIIGNRFRIIESSVIDTENNFTCKVLTNMVANPTGTEEALVTTSSDARYLWVYTSNDGNFVSNPPIMICEGTVATDYEDYFERTADVYLNSPLLENDEIVMYDGELCHYHKYRQISKDFIMSNVVKGSISSDGNFINYHITNIKAINDGTVHKGIICNHLIPTGASRYNHIYKYTNGEQFVIQLSSSIDTLSKFEDFVTTNNTNIVYELAEPYYEPIQTDKLLLECTNNSTLYVDTIIPTQLISFKSFEEEIEMLEPNVQYRVSFKCDKQNTPLNITLGGTLTSHTSLSYNTLLITTPAALADNKLIIDGQGCNISECVITKGDIEYPYFEGMKSVGQDDENGHKIEILSRNKNLFDIDRLKATNANITSFVKNKAIGRVEISYKANCGYPYVYYELTNEEINFIKGKKILIKKDLIQYDSNVNHTIQIFVAKEDGTGVWLVDGSYIPTTAKTAKIQVHGHNSPSSSNCIANTTIYENIYIGIEEMGSTYIPQSSNKKEILMNEPLRGLPNGVKDKKVKIGNKWYIERNLYGITLNGNSNENWVLSFPDFGTPIFSWNKTGINIYKSDSYNSILSDRFAYAKQYSQTEVNHKCIYVYNYGDANQQSIRIQYPLNSVEEFRNYLSSNPINVIIRLETPIYEPLEIEPTLNTYTDVTHISNNSLIPCNMTIKNTGYNAIIKPSTLYTIALDTNRTGTIGCNLGGTKGTTTNNVLTLTTPAILADDSLRIYGKGIKGSKVRLLEGDKTNWVPSHFEGMKSSFEDKLQDDGTYKMEILSNNENLVGLKSENAYGLVSGGSYEIHSENSLTLKGVKSYNSIKFKQKLKPLTKYYISCDVTLKKGSKATIRLIENRIGVPDVYTTLYNSDFITINNKVHIEGEFTTKYVTDLAIYPNSVWETTEESELLVENLQISEAVCDFTKNKSNKIQFSSIEPLRGVGDVKDRFVFKDGKLMIERNIKQITCDGSQLVYYTSWYTNDSLVRISIKTNKTDIPKNKYNIPPISSQYIGYKWDTSINKESMHIGGSDNIYFVMDSRRFETQDLNGAKKYFSENPSTFCYVMDSPTYEEIPYELQKIILEGYENGTLFFDTNIPPTATVTYAGEAPIVTAVKSTKTNVLSNTDDINDNIVPYLMDMDYRVVCLQLADNTESISVARLLGSTYEMLQRDIQSRRYPVDEYKHRLDAYLEVKKITEEEYIKLGEMLNE